MLPRYEFDRARSKIVYSVEAYGIEVAGLLRSVAGGFVFDPEAPEQSSVIATIDAASVDMGDSALDSLVRSGRFLDTGRYPLITFQSTSVAAADGGELRVSGVLSLAGTEQPMTLTVRGVGVGTDLVTGQRTAGFVARGEFSRSIFGLSLGLPAIGDKVQFTIYAAGNLLD